MNGWSKIFFILFLLGLVVFFNSLNNKFQMDDFFFWGDPALSTPKFVMSHWDPEAKKRMGVIDGQAIDPYYRPLTDSIYDLCYGTFKNDVWKYHLFNLLIFTFASSLLFLFIARVSGNEGLALLTSILFLIHPINGIVVNYISASVFAFEVIFILGSVLLILEYLENKNDPFLYLLSIGCCFLSMFWHESGVMAPIYISAVILLCVEKPLKSKAKYLLPYFMIFAFYLYFRINSLDLKGTVLKHNAGEYGASLFRVLYWYISKLFYPKGIVMQWSVPIMHDHIIWNVMALFTLIIVLFLFFFRYSQNRVLRLAIAWFVIGIIPVCYAAFRRPDSGVQMEPHWMIISSIGFFITISYMFLKFMDRSKIGGLTLLMTVILGLGAVSHAYNQIWSDQRTYALFWTQQAPDFKQAYYYLGTAYQRQKDYPDAKRSYQLALDGYNSDGFIYNNLGLIENDEGHWKKAELYYIKALKINPFSSAAYRNLGMLYLKIGDLDRSKGCLMRSLAYDPLMVETRSALAYVSFLQHDYQKAADLCRKNLEIVDYDTNTVQMLIEISIHQNNIGNIYKYAYYMIGHETDPMALTALTGVMAKHGLNRIALDAYHRMSQIKGLGDR